MPGAVAPRWDTGTSLCRVGISIGGAAVSIRRHRVRSKLEHVPFFSSSFCRRGSAQALGWVVSSADPYRRTDQRRHDRILGPLGHVCRGGLSTPTRRRLRNESSHHHPHGGCRSEPRSHCHARRALGPEESAPGQPMGATRPQLLGSNAILDRSSHGPAQHADDRRVVSDVPRLCAVQARSRHRGRWCHDGRDPSLRRRAPTVRAGGPVAARRGPAGRESAEHLARDARICLSAHGGSAGPSDQATALGQLVTSRRWQLAVAESLTGGQLSATIGRGVDARRWFKGGVVAYQRAVKQQLLGVFDGPLVSSRCACEMAVGAATLPGSDVGLAITGVGGPEPDEGHEAGTVWIAVRAPLGTRSVLHHRRRFARRDLHCRLVEAVEFALGHAFGVPAAAGRGHPSATGFETRGASSRRDGRGHHILGASPGPV